MRFERLMAYYCCSFFLVSAIVALANGLMGQEFWAQSERATMWFVAFFGWLSAHRWREAAETSAASVQQIKQNWSAE